MSDLKYELGTASIPAQRSAPRQEQVPARSRVAMDHGSRRRSRVPVLLAIALAVPMASFGLGFAASQDASPTQLPTPAPTGGWRQLLSVPLEPNQAPATETDPHGWIVRLLTPPRS